MLIIQVPCISYPEKTDKAEKRSKYQRAEQNSYYPVVENPTIGTEPCIQSGW